MIRRNFLKTSGLLSLASSVPLFVNRLAAQTQAKTDEKILVVIEMNGGNDGINTIVPHKDPEYARRRPKLKLDRKRLHRINDEMAFHPSMRRSKEQFDAGEFSVINGVGYPNPDRSHFASLEIWHRGLREGKRESGAGWLGSALDFARDPAAASMDGYFVGTQSVSAAMVSRRAQVAALSRIEDLKIDPAIKLIDNSAGGDVAAFVQRQVTNAHATSRQIESVSKQTGSSGFSGDKLSQQMKLISQLIKSGSRARVYYTVQGGYDTHSVQLASHADLLFSLSRAIKSFVDDLKRDGLADRVVVVAFSEFGRRVSENNSIGTDHGTAGPVFLAGTKIKPGFHGAATSLTDLENDDLKHQFDFQQVYASLLNNWLGISSESILGEKFEALDLFA